MPNADSNTAPIEKFPHYEVVIIGAGPAGLISAKTLKEHNVDNILVLEQTSSAGGLWNRESTTRTTDSPCTIHDNDNTNAEPIPVASSPQPVYPNLRANFPKDMTSFLGHPFDADLPSYPDAATITAYYHGFSQHFGIDKVTRYHQQVISCTKLKANTNDNNPLGSTATAENDYWSIETIDTNTQQTHRYTSQRLVVCNGHFQKAFVPPTIPGIKHFTGELLHSSAFRSPQKWENQSVFIVGGGVSGSDIARILLKRGNCARVVVSIRNWKAWQTVLFGRLVRKYPRLILRPGMSHMDKEGRVHFAEPREDTKHKYNADSSTTEQPNVILFATGYRYHFPFFNHNINHNKSPFVRSDGFKMERLYKRILSIDDPSLAFIGIPNQNLSPAIVMEYQAQWFVHKVVLSQGNLPSHKEMLQEWQTRQANDPTQDTLGAQCPSYCNSLAADIVGRRGYFLQMLCDRLPLMARTEWVHFQKKNVARSRNIPRTGWLVAAATSAGALSVAVAWKYNMLSDRRDRRG